MNKGDKVRVVGNSTSHGFKIGDVVTYTGHEKAWVKSFSLGLRYWWMSDSDYEPLSKTYILEVGETYTNINGDNWECIDVKGDVAWLVRCCDDDVCGAAYSFKTDGTPICLDGGYGVYRIKFPQKIKQQQYDVIVDGVAVAINYKTVDGVPDFTDATVVPF